VCDNDFGHVTGIFSVFDNDLVTWQEYSEFVTLDLSRGRNILSV
jgi:limonene-1,2-epoxide hydrolase